MILYSPQVLQSLSWGLENVWEALRGGNDLYKFSGWNTFRKDAGFLVLICSVQCMTTYLERFLYRAHMGFKKRSVPAETLRNCFLSFFRSITKSNKRYNYFSCFDHFGGLLLDFGVWILDFGIWFLIFAFSTHPKLLSLIRGQGFLIIQTFPSHPHPSMVFWNRIIQYILHRCQFDFGWLSRFEAILVLCVYCVCPFKLAPLHPKYFLGALILCFSLRAFWCEVVVTAPMVLPSVFRVFWFFNELGLGLGWLIDSIQMGLHAFWMRIC